MNQRNINNVISYDIYKRYSNMPLHITGHRSSERLHLFGKIVLHKGLEMRLDNVRLAFVASFKIL